MSGVLRCGRRILNRLSRRLRRKLPVLSFGLHRPLRVDGKHWLLLGGDIHTLNLYGGSVKKLDIRHTFQRNLRAEFDQMFEEMLANLESNFSNEDFHGRDWEAIRERYRRFMPYVRSRADCVS